MLSRIRLSPWLHAAAKLPTFGVGGTDEAWRSLSASLLAEFNAEQESMISINELLGTLGSKNMCLGSFWFQFFEKKINPKIASEKVQLAHLVELVRVCNSVDFRPEAVIAKLVQSLIASETLWIIPPSELVEVADVLADSRTQHRQLFLEIANRVCLEHAEEFTASQLVALMVSFSKINFVNQKMFERIMVRLLAEPVAIAENVSAATAISKLRFRSDTFFKNLCQQKLSGLQAAEVCVAMNRLKMHAGETQWWNRALDYARLLKMAKDDFSCINIAAMSASDLSHCCQITKPNRVLADATVHRLKHLLVQEPLAKAHQHLAVILEALARADSVHADNLRWLGEWLCGNVYIFPVHDIAIINRSIARLGFRDHAYHKIWAPYYLERLEELTKDDVSTISDTFNSIGIGETLLGGRHFFYKLGKRFQQLTVETTGDKEINSNKKYRNLLQRLG